MVVWGLTAVAAVAWGLRVGGKTTPVPAHATVATASAVAGGDLSRVLGATPVVAEQAAPPPPGDARFKLLGVVAPRAGQAPSLAVVAVDGQIPRTLRLGREIEPGLVLHSVGHRRVELWASGRPSVVLELPALAEAQRGQPGMPLLGPASRMPPGPGMFVPPPGSAPSPLPPGQFSGPSAAANAAANAAAAAAANAAPIGAPLMPIGAPPGAEPSSGGPAGQPSR